MGNKNVKITKPTGSSSFPTYNKSSVPTTIANHGLLIKNLNTLVPIKSVSVDGQVADYIGSLSLTHTYKNTDTNPIEAVFKFPLYRTEKTIAFNGLTIEVEGKPKIIGKVKEKQKAYDTYDDAIASGHGAYLVESSKEENADVYSMSVGSIPPNTTVKVTLSLAFELPTEVDKKTEAIVFSLPRELLPAADYEFSGKLHIKSPQGIAKIKLQSSTSDIDKHHTVTKVTNNESIIEIPTTSQPPHGHLTVHVTLVKKNEPAAILEYSPTHHTHALSVTFQPSWTELDPDLIVPYSEIIFLVDRSGSMSGGKIKQVCSTMLLFMKSLPDTVKFNIIGFGSSDVWLFPQSVAYTEETMATAIQHIESISANLGGTELLYPLRKIFNLPYLEEYPRQVFVLTDGEVDNRDATIDIAVRAANSTRIFTLGIGGDVDRVLVNSLAEAANGHADFIGSSDGSQAMEAKVLSQLKRALEPTLRKVRVQWGPFLEQKNPRTAPKLIRPIFNGERMTVTALLENVDEKSLGELPEDYTVNLVGLGPYGDEMTFPIALKSAGKGLISIKGNMVHTVTVKKLINDLEGEHDEHSQKEIVRLGVKYNIVTSKTSLVAVEEREESVEGSMKQVELPAFSTVSQNRRMSFGGGVSSDDDSDGSMDIEDRRDSFAQQSAVPQLAKKSTGVFGGFAKGGAPPRSAAPMVSRSRVSHQKEKKKESGRRASSSFKDQDDDMKIHSIQSQLSEVNSIMHQNIDSLLSRADKLDDLMLDEMEEESLDGALFGAAPSSPRKVNAFSDDLFAPPPPPPTSSISMEYAPPPPPAAAPVSYSSSSFSGISSVPAAPISSVSAPLPARPATLTVNDIAKVQKANGSFTVDAVAWILKTNNAEVKDFIKSVKLSPGTAEDVVDALITTAIVLAVLEKYFASGKSSWELFADKARKWLKRTAVTSKVTVDGSSDPIDQAMIQAASKFASSHKI